jgi:EAL domain-containing protein (putative c-di-GMP-specific phosphodiesterase class I)/AmiR/NasT family two-component response regulator
VSWISTELERFSSMSVLVVDDNAENLAFVGQVLRRAGMRHLTMLQDPHRVEGLLGDVSPDLVLLDLHMPGMDGHEVLQQIVQFAAGSYLPVLVLTADGSSRARNQALSRGARDFLTKPLDITELTLRVANLLETRMLYQQLLVDAEEGRATAAVKASSRASVQAVIDQRAVRAALQPVVDLHSMGVVGFEALARFDEPHPRGPAGWFAEAAAADLGVELEGVAADAAMATLDQLGDGQFLAVNLSPASVLRLPAHPLAQPEVFPRLVVELTEHVPVQDYGAVHRALAEMRSAGARLAADDLGSGYAGFRHLVALEPDIIKLDISLVRGIHESRSQRALASALQAFAADVGATVIAEGIEDAEEMNVLVDLGVAWGQGFLLGRPIIPDQS